MIDFYIYYAKDDGGQQIALHFTCDGSFENWSSEGARLTVQHIEEALKGWRKSVEYINGPAPDQADSVSSLPSASYQYDDPRYGWISVQAYGRKDIDLVIQMDDGVYGYTFKDGEFEAHCVCHAYHIGECSCMTGQWDND
jgi:hypothetical protein